MKRQTTTAKQSQHGQSLVEVALFFPIFIILLAGLVEVSQLLVTQNRISSATRAGARFASDGGEDAGIVTVVLNSVTQTLELDPEVWDIWSIRATVNSAGTSINDEDWEFTHIYGVSQTVRFDSVDEEEIKAQIEDELRRDEFTNVSAGIAADLQIVGTYSIHDVESILGLEAMPQLAGFSSLDALSVMRITATSQEATNGCAAFPLAITDGVRSVGAGSDPYPTTFQYPTNPPPLASFVSHRANISLLDATEGMVFYFDAADFDWLIWNDGLSNTGGTLSTALDWPGTSTNYAACAGCGTAVAGSGHATAVRGYIEPGDPTDQQIQEGDNVRISNGTLTNVTAVMQEHINMDRALRVIVWGENTGSQIGISPDNAFAIIRFIGYNATANWIVAEFIRWDDSCGQVN